MAFIKCPKCGTEVYDSLNVCMRCGFPLMKNKPIKVDENKILNNLNTVNNPLENNINFEEKSNNAIKIENDTILIDNSSEKSIEEKIKELEEKLNLTPTVEKTPTFSEIETHSINEEKEEPKVEIKEEIKEEKVEVKEEAKEEIEEEKVEIKEKVKEDIKIEVKEENYTCLKCGFSYSNDFNFCPKCACPKGTDPEEEQAKMQEELNNKKEEKHKEQVEKLIDKKDAEEEKKEDLDKEDKSEKEEQETLEEKESKPEEEIKSSEEESKPKKEDKEEKTSKKDEKEDLDKEEVKEETKKKSKKKSHKEKLEENELRCPDCGEVFENTLDECPNCGCPKDLVLLDMEMMDNYNKDIKENNKDYFDSGIEKGDEEETTEVEEVEEPKEEQEEQEEPKEEIKEETQEEVKEEVKEEAPIEEKKELSREEELQKKIKELEARLYGGNQNITVNLKKIEDSDDKKEEKTEIKETKEEKEEVFDEEKKEIESQEEVKEEPKDDTIADLISKASETNTEYTLITCSKCGSSISESFKVCPFCGNKFTDEEVETNNSDNNIKSIVNKIGFDKVLVLAIILVFLALLIVFLTSCKNTKFTVPDLLGQDEESVKLIMDKYGLQYKVVTKPSSTVQKGFVISYSPEEIDKEKGIVKVIISAGNDKIESTGCSISYPKEKDVWDFENPYIEDGYLILKLKFDPETSFELNKEESYVSLTNDYSKKIKVEIESDNKFTHGTKTNLTLKVPCTSLESSDPNKLFIVVKGNSDGTIIDNKINFTINW